MKKFKDVLALTLVAVLVISLSSCLKYTGNIFELTTAPGGMNQGGNQQNPIVTYPQVTQPQLTYPQVTLPQVTVPQGETTTAPVTPPQGETTTAPAVSDPSSWTTAEILKFTTDAVTKTKAYTSKVTVDHAENFDVRITKAPGGQLVMDTADRIIASVAKPSQEVLTFTNGRTTNAEGEDVPLLLPKRGAFTLTSDGVASATAKKSGENVVINIKLVKEVGTLTDHPKHHAASVGYLDASDVDLSGITLNYLDITYSGTTLELVVNPDGYVASAVYKIPIHIAVEAKIAFITAAGECEGSQSETWKINW